MNINRIISEELGIKEKQVDVVRNLLNEGNTIPFIARYRKELTGSLDDEVLRKLSDRLTYLTNLQERIDTVLKTLEELGVLNDDLKNSIENVSTLTELEDIYRPYKPKKKTRAGIAKEKGLDGLAQFILKQDYNSDINEEVEKYISEEKGVLNYEDAISGARDIIAEIISDNAKYRAHIRNLIKKYGVITTKKIKSDEKDTFAMYQEYREPLNRIANHRVLAINRGENMKCLKVSIEIDEKTPVNYLEKSIIKHSSPVEEEIKLAIMDSYKRLIFPSLENEIRNELTERAEESSMNVFRENLRQLLLVAPVQHQIVLGFDPAFRTGCKLAVVDEFGKVLKTGVIYPTPPHNKIEESSKVILELINKYHISLIALGNGTASRESEQFLKKLIEDNHLSLSYVIVNEAGASVYSASKLGTKEFPNFDVALRSAVSLARRLQDPLAELVKIDPKAIGVGQYQHDMNQKRLGEVLSGVVESCVNSVGVDLNTASSSLLEYVSGISSSISQNIVAYREEHGPFKSKKELLNVPKLGPKAFEQCAGFLRIRDGYPLDNTAVHPESYEFAIRLVTELNCTLNDIGSENLKEKLLGIKSIKEVAKSLEVGEPTIEDIIQELIKPGRDPRLEIEKAELINDVKEIEDLKIGMVLNGTIRNIMDFGVFVDIGVHQDGLVHISELSNSFIKHPLEVVKINQIVKVKVIQVDTIKKRIGLSIKQVNE